MLSELNSEKMVLEFGMVKNYDLVSVWSVYDYPLDALLCVPNANDMVEQEPIYVEKDFYQMMYR
jgi:hypothetical protein